MDCRTGLVRAGYDVIVETYHASREAKDDANKAWLDGLRHHLPPTGVAVDLGCGAGVPITRYFAEGGYDVTGYDVSAKMLELARKNVPSARFEQTAVQDLRLPADSIDLVLSFFAIIHIERVLHAELFRRMFEWLRPGGIALLSLGAGDNPQEHQDDWLGAPMEWSHFDAETNLRMLRKAGFQIAWSDVEEFAEGERHLFVIATKTRPQDGSAG